MHFPAYTALAIEDGGGGAILTSACRRPSLDAYRPGNELRVVGMVSQGLGMPVIASKTIDLLGQRPVPVPVSVAPRDLQDFRYLGRLVRTQGRVESTGLTSSGPSITLSDAGRFGFSCRANKTAPGEFTSFGKGDLVEATGIASQYCPRPPYNRSFEILAPAPESVIRKERALGLPIIAVGLGLVLVLVTGFVLWSRERRLRSQRERLRKTYQLGEEILGAASPEAVWKRIAETLPSILGITRVHLYVHNRAAKTLDGVAEQAGESVSILLSAPPAGTQSGAAACFHYRTLLVIPDISRSPFPIATPDRSDAAIPALRSHDGARRSHRRDGAGSGRPHARFLGRRTGSGAALGQSDRRRVASAGAALRSGAALPHGEDGGGGPLDFGRGERTANSAAIHHRTGQTRLERESLGAAERDLKAISSEAQKASGMVARLVSYAAAEQSEARPVSVGALLRTLIEFREGDWKASGIRLTETISREPLNVLGSQGQLEQVFLNLLVHAEQAIGRIASQEIAIRTSVLAKRLLVEISFSAAPESSKPEDAASILGVTRSVVAGHGGEVRLIEKPNFDPRFEVELPLLAQRPRRGVPPPPPPTPHEPGSRMTALVIEPEESAQRQLIALLSARGFRVVPLANADNGLDLAQRMRFDVAFVRSTRPG